MIIMIFLKAFLVGGLICVIGQLLLDLTKLTPAKILVGFVVVGVILGGIGVYKYVEEFAGAGATVPLVGFGALLAEETKNAVKEDGIFGIITGPLAAGSAGIMTAVLCGIVASFFGKPKAK